MHIDWIVYFQFILNVWIYFFQATSNVKNIVFHCISIWIICVIRFFDLAKMVRDSLFKSIKMTGFWRFLLLNSSVKICQNLSKLPTMEYICQIRLFIHLPGDSFSKLKICRRYYIKIQSVAFSLTGFSMMDDIEVKRTPVSTASYYMYCLPFVPEIRLLQLCNFVTSAVVKEGLSMFLSEIEGFLHIISNKIDALMMQLMQWDSSMRISVPVFEHPSSLWCLSNHETVGRIFSFMLA